MRSPSRRNVLAVGGGLLAGLAGGYVARPYLDAESPSDPTPLAWADTEWPYPDYDAARTRNPPAESAPAGSPSEQWRYQVPPSELPAVVAANDRVLVGVPDAGEGRVACLDADTGDERWVVLAGGAHGVPVAAPGDRVFTRGREHDVLASRAAATGDSLWTTRTEDSLQSTLGGGRQYVLGRGGDGVRVRALDARTGDTLWTTTATRRGGHFAVAAHVPSDDRLVLRTGTSVAVLDASDGSTVWHEPVGGNGFVSGPVVAGGRVFHAAFQAGVGAFDVDTGERLWREYVDPELQDADDPRVARYFEVGAATGSELLAVERHGDESPDQLVAFDAASGDRRWRTDYGGETSVSRPTIVDRTAYASVGTDRRQRLVAVDLADGMETASWSLPTYGGAPVVTDGLVVVPTYDAVVALA